MTIEEIYERYFDALSSYVDKMVRNQFMRDEIVNETFYKAMQALEAYDGGEATMLSWLRTIAKNCYLNKLREMKYIASIDDIDEIHLSVSDKTLTQIIDNDDVKKARQALHSLPEPYKEIYMWRALIGLRHKDIAELFDMNENWSNQMYWKARNKLLSDFHNKNCR